MQVTITLFYGGALALWFIVLSLRVVQGRVGADNPGIGDGGDIIMQRKIRAHGNFAEYVPLTLVLIGFLEINGSASWVIHVLGACLLIGRLLHGYAFAYTKEHVFGRSTGIALTLLSLLAAGVLALVSGIVINN